MVFIEDVKDVLDYRFLGISKVSQFIKDLELTDEIYLSTRESVNSLLMELEININNDSLNPIKDNASFSDLYEKYDYIHSYLSKGILRSVASNPKEWLSRLGKFNVFNLLIQMNYILGRGDGLNWFKNNMVFDYHELEIHYPGINHMLEHNHSYLSYIRLAHNMREHWALLRTMAILNECEVEELDEKIVNKSLKGIFNEESLGKGIEKMLTPYMINERDNHINYEIYNDMDYVDKLGMLNEFGVLQILDNDSFIPTIDYEDITLEDSNNIILDWFKALQNEYYNRKDGDIGKEEEDIESLLVSWNLPTYKELEESGVLDCYDPTMHTSFESRKSHILTNYYLSYLGLSLETIGGEALEYMKDPSYRLELTGMHDEQLKHSIELLCDGMIMEESGGFMTLIITLIGGYIIANEQDGITIIKKVIEPKKRDISLSEFRETIPDGDIGTIF